ncbi:MAG: acyl carrier protein [Aeromicrobium erythreum]
MPTRAEVRAQVRDILVAVVDCDPDAVTDDAVLKTLGVDSLALVEVADEVGRRFGRTIPDETVDAMTTVDDVVRAVLEPGTVSGSTVPTPQVPAAATAAGNGATATAATSGTASSGRTLTGQSSAATRLALWFVAAGATIGLLFGFGGSLAVQALGLGDVNLPPINPETSATPTPTPSATPTPTPTIDEESPDPTFQIESAQVSPGQRFRISGRFPDLDTGAVLDVQVRDEGSDEWDDFAGVKVQVKDGGRFETQIYTSRTGVREFRMKAEDGGQVSPVAKVRIG